MSLRRVLLKPSIINDHFEVQTFGFLFFFCLHGFASIGSEPDLHNGLTLLGPGRGSSLKTIPQTNGYNQTVRERLFYHTFVLEKKQAVVLHQRSGVAWFLKGVDLSGAEELRNAFGQLQSCGKNVSFESIKLLNT